MQSGQQQSLFGVDNNCLDDEEGSSDQQDFSS
jgi:hypothetical protein